MHSTIYITDWLNDNRLIACPTDTVWGLMGKSNSSIARDLLYQVKQRHRDKALVLFVPNAQMMLPYISPSQIASFLRLSQAFWPGPLTIVVDIAVDHNHSLSPLIAASDTPMDTLALRMPDCALILDLLTQMQMPLFSTSMNISGQPDVQNYTQAQKMLNELDPALVAKILLLPDHTINAMIPEEQIKLAKPSTIVKLTDDPLVSFIMLREGEVSCAAVVFVLEMVDKKV